MNRVVLLLNVIILVVNFVLTMSATESQIGILASTSRAASGYGRASALPSRDAFIAYLRVVQSLDGVFPQGKADELTVTQRRTIYEAVDRYYGAIGDGVLTILDINDGAKMGRASNELGKAARLEVERVLMASFPSSSDVTRLATEIIRSCR